MKLLLVLILLFGADIFSQETTLSNDNLNSSFNYSDETTYIIRLKIFDNKMVPIQYAVVSFVTFDKYETKSKCIGESNNNGDFFISLSTEIEYDYLEITYPGYENYFISIKDKKSINLKINMILTTDTDNY